MILVAKQARGKPGRKPKCDDQNLVDGGKFLKRKPGRPRKNSIQNLAGGAPSVEILVSRMSNAENMPPLSRRASTNRLEPLAGSSRIIIPIKVKKIQAQVGDKTIHDPVSEQSSNGKDPNYVPSELGEPRAKKRNF